MNLSKQEFELIEKAEQAVLKTRNSAVILLVTLGTSFLAFLGGRLEPDFFAILCCAISMITVCLPQIHGPKYRDIVKLLAKLRSDPEPEPIDTLIDVLSRKP